MKITPIVPALAAMLGLALTSLSSSAQTTTNTTTPPAPTPAATTPTTPTTPTKPTKSSKPKTKTKSTKTQYSGKITALSATSVTVQGKATLTLAINGTTKFRIDKKKAAASAFAVGDAITGSYTKDSTGAMTAASIDKKAAAPAAPTTPAAQ